MPPIDVQFPTVGLWGPENRQPHEWASYAMTRNMKPEALATKELGLEPGTPVILEAEGSGTKIRTRYIGAEEDCYVIVSLVPVQEYGATMAQLMRRGTKVKVFFSSEGSVHGFLAKVLASTTKPFLHLYLSYPGDLEACNLRMNERTECHLPAVVDLFGGDIDGMVVNISAGGCALSLPLPGQEGVGTFHKGDRLSLRFHINVSSREYRAACRVMNVRDCGDKTLIGLGFEDLDASAKKSVVDFIRYVQQHRI